MYLTTGSFLIKANRIDDAIAAMRKIVALGRTEKGIVRYQFYQDPDDAARLFLFEEWESKAAHDVHFESDAMQSIVPEFFDTLAEPPAVTYYDAEVESTM